MSSSFARVFVAAAIGAASVIAAPPPAAAQVQGPALGKDKTPIGHELLIGDAYLLFPERALASSLVPNRDIGVAVQGDVAGNAKSFTIAANWYPTPYIKYCATFERTTFGGGATARPGGNVILFRTQLAF